MLIECELTRIIIDENKESQVIILKEKEGQRAFPIVIGIFEAMAIDRRLKNIPYPRPLTHDLLANVIEGLNSRLERIVITELRDNTFFAKLTLGTAAGTVEIDSRPSDAIALGVRMGAPIFVEDEVLNKVSSP